MRQAVWMFVHNLLAHPLLAVTGNSSFATSFHDWTAARADGVSLNGVQPPMPPATDAGSSRDGVGE